MTAAALAPGQLLSRQPPPGGMPAGQPRARGAVRLAAARQGGATRIAALRQEGSLKLLFPQVRGAGLEAVMLNTAGGLTGGDRMRASLALDSGAQVTLTTQAAERVYRAAGGRAEVTSAVTLAPGARLDWLPQETILFDGAALDRRLRLEIDPAAEALVCEALIFGRRAMGERLSRAALTERWEVRRAGRLVFADALRLGPELSGLGAPALLGGAGAAASLLFLSPRAGGMLAPLRALLPPAGGVSLVRDGVLFLRLRAEDGFELRRGLVPALEHLRGSALPKHWRL